MPTTPATAPGPRIAVDRRTTPVEVSDPLAAYVARRDLVGEEQVFLLEPLAGPVADTRASLVRVSGLLEVQVHRSRVRFSGVPALIALAATSLPSAVMVARALGWRTTAAAGGATMVAALLGGGLLTLLG